MRPDASLAADDGESLSLPAAGARHARRVWRLLRVVMHIGTGFGLALVTGAVFSPHRPVVRNAARWWLRRLTRILQVEIVMHGAPATGPALFVANHVSWLDIPVLGGALPVNFLSKAEVGRWPVIGQL
ncbi:MAG: lysophospholipid acyltransferase family protein, partial [Gammaproteobacteria bacterium]